MSTEPQPSAAASGIVARIQNILLKPAAEWERIAGEPTDVGKLYMGYVVPLAALGSVCMVIGLAVFGIGGWMVSIHYTWLQAIVEGVIRFVTAVGGIFIMALIIDALAPNFGSEKNALQAHKLAAYAATAGLLAAVFMIYPPLGVLGLLGLYSFVLLYMGLPRLMKTPQDKRVGYFVTIIVVCIVVGLVLGVVLGIVARPLMGPMTAPGGVIQVGQTGTPQVQGRVTLPNGASVDVGQAQRAVEQMQQQMNNPNAHPVDLTQLQALLPASLPGGYNRTSASSGSGGMMGAGAATASAVYQRGDARIELSVAQTMGVASMIGALGVQANEETSDGYSRVNQVNGRTVTEELSRSAGTAKYAVIGRNGAIVSAEGSGGASMDDVHNAVGVIGVERVEALGT